MEIIKMMELDQPVIDNLTKIYNEIASLKEQIIDLLNQKSQPDTSKKVINSLLSKTIIKFIHIMLQILVAGKYPIEKARVSYGLAKTTIEKYFRELIAHGWKHDEKANHNLTGAGARGNKKINTDKMNGFIDYCLNSWNEFHEKNSPGTNAVVPHHLIDEKRKTLKSLMGLICQEETRRAKKMNN